VSSATLDRLKFVAAVIVFLTLVLAPDRLVMAALTWMSFAVVAITTYHAFSPYWSDFIKMFGAGVQDGEVVDPMVRQGRSPNPEEVTDGSSEGPSDGRKQAA
jgi:hypothetical protein